VKKQNQDLQPRQQKLGSAIDLEYERRNTLETTPEIGQRFNSQVQLEYINWTFLRQAHTSIHQSDIL
jgi:hypothetical protein